MTFNALSPSFFGVQLMQQLCILQQRLSSLNHHHTGDGSKTLQPLTTDETGGIIYRKVLPIFQTLTVTFLLEQPLLALNCLLRFKRSPPSLPNTPNAVLNKAILFIGAVGGLWVTLCPFKKIICFPFNGLRMTNCFQGKMKLGKLHDTQRNIDST